jgi:type I restriction enzyme S subunit
MSLPTYSKYKSSGVEWMGNIPAHWAVSQSRRLFKVRSEPAQPDDQMLTASQKYGVLPQAEFMLREGRRVVEVIQGVESLKHVEPDDFIISMRSFQGGIEWCRLRGSTSFHYVMLTPVKWVWPAFFSYLLKSTPYIQALRRTTDLIRDGQELRFSNFAQVPLPVVPLDEQKVIAAFLDHEVAKIDALITGQEKLTALLAEKRQATISQAITKGLNSNVPMKDSGVAWLGEVPRHWKVGKARFYISVLPGYAFSSTGFSTDECNVKLLRGINVAVGELRWDEVVYWKRTEADGLGPFELKAGDVVIGMDRPLISSGMRVAIVKQEDLPCMLLQRVAKVQPGASIDGRFIMRLLSSRAFEAHFTPDTTGVSVPHISGEQISSFVVPVPPLDEQLQICDFLDAELAKLDALNREVGRTITLLGERRGALIAAAVTGQIDVHDAVPLELAA